MRLLHVRDQQHVWAFAIEIEPVLGVFRQNRGREWPEALAILYLEIENLLCVERPWIGEDRSIAERAGSEFHPALCPSDRLTFVYCMSRNVDDCILIGQYIELGAFGNESFLDFSL